jgi:hypothetical protein
MTLLVKSRWPISNVKGVRVTRDMGSVSLTFECCVSARFSAPFELTNRVKNGLTRARMEAKTQRLQSIQERRYGRDQACRFRIE